MNRVWRKLNWVWIGGLLTGIAVCGALVMGYWLGRNHSANPFETALHATATHGGDTMALATGPVDEGDEGLFILDYLTGELQCMVISPRNTPTKFFARFRTNVVQVLGVEQGKKPNYVMVTGHMDFQRGAAAARPGNCVVYVCDTITGNYAAFGIPWNRTFAAAGRPQQGALVLLDVGKARNLEGIE
jgi:hypothetical protein